MGEQRAYEIDAVFLDRDGTIGGTGHFVHPNQFALYPFSKKAIQLLKENGIKIVAVTNQHRISTGVVSRQDFEEEFRAFGFDGWYICPHAMDEACACKKPQPGMLLEAAEDLNLDLKRCVFIGDVGSTDMLAAAAAGCRKVLVKTGWGADSLETYRSKWSEVTPDHIAENVLDAVQWVLNEPSFQRKTTVQ
ncbi:HAD-IIIA family hydrolase [Paenibacillus pinihumi]|uniref:HAD-IIIA family hydrolase n=1 Tax=Paenibacillus pinihumi TaxID=669462 RepID=UPI000429C790|nr:HAD-IIIA family hydrolase [Paenibacillus pinihumi]